LLGELLVLIPLDVLPPSASPTGAGPGVYPSRGQGFAAYIVGGFFGVGVIILAMVLLSLKPRRVDPDGPDPKRR
jgi:hypothetical protein